MSDIETRVRDAITMHVDFMDGSPQVVERAIDGAERVRRRERRRRALAGGLAATLGLVVLVGIAIAVHDDSARVTVAAGSPTSTATATQTTSATNVPTADALVAQWNTTCGVAPTFAPVAGLQFTIDLASRAVRQGASTPVAILLENTTATNITFGTGMGTWYVTTPSGRVVGTSAGYPVLSIGYRVAVPAHSRAIARQPQAEIAANSGSCAGSEFTPPRPVPLQAGRYWAWFALPDSEGSMFVSQPTPFDVTAAP